MVAVTMKQIIRSSQLEQSISAASHCMSQTVHE